jgi:hypothetical protein
MRAVVGQTLFTPRQPLMGALARLRPVNGPLVDRDKYRAEGFVVAKGVIDVGLLESLIHEMDILQLRRLALASTPGGTREALHANAQRLLAADAPAYLATARLTQSLPSARALMISEPIPPHCTQRRLRQRRGAKLGGAGVSDTGRPAPRVSSRARLVGFHVG